MSGLGKLGEYVRCCSESPLSALCGLVCFRPIPDLDDNAQRRSAASPKQPIVHPTALLSFPHAQSAVMVGSWSARVVTASSSGARNIRVAKGHSRYASPSEIKLRDQKGSQSRVDREQLPLWWQQEPSMGWGARVCGVYGFAMATSSGVSP